LLDITLASSKVTPIEPGACNLAESTVQPTFPEETIMLNHIKSGVAIASAAAALFAVTASVATQVQAAEEGTVKCAGVNT
jgi:hypothetical protein